MILQSLKIDKKEPEEEITSLNGKDPDKLTQKQIFRYLKSKVEEGEKLGLNKDKMVYVGRGTGNQTNIGAPIGFGLPKFIAKLDHTISVTNANGIVLSGINPQNNYFIHEQDWEELKKNFDIEELQLGIVAPSKIPAQKLYEYFKAKVEEGKKNGINLPYRVYMGGGTGNSFKSSNYNLHDYIKILSDSAALVDENSKTAFGAYTYKSYFLPTDSWNEIVKEFENKEPEQNTDKISYKQYFIDLAKNSSAGGSYRYIGLYAVSKDAHALLKKAGYTGSKQQFRRDTKTTNSGDYYMKTAPWEKLFKENPVDKEMANLDKIARKKQFIDLAKNSPAGAVAHYIGNYEGSGEARAALKAVGYEGDAAQFNKDGYLNGFSGAYYMYVAPWEKLFGPSPSVNKKENKMSEDDIATFKKMAMQVRAPANWVYIGVYNSINYLVEYLKEIHFPVEKITNNWMQSDNEYYIRSRVWKSVFGFDPPKKPKKLPPINTDDNKEPEQDPDDWS